MDVCAGKDLIILRGMVWLAVMAMLIELLGSVRLVRSLMAIRWIMLWTEGVCTGTAWRLST